MFVGRGSGLPRGPAGQAVRGPGGQAARQAAGRDRARARAVLHRQRAQVQAAGQPRSAARRDRRLQGPSLQADRADPAAVVCTLGNFATKLLSGRPDGITQGPRHSADPRDRRAGRCSSTRSSIRRPRFDTPAMLEQLRADFARIPSCSSKGRRDAASEAGAACAAAGARADAAADPRADAAADPRADARRRSRSRRLRRYPSRRRLRSWSEPRPAGPRAPTTSSSACSRRRGGASARAASAPSSTLVPCRRSSSTASRPSETERMPQSLAEGLRTGRRRAGRRRRRHRQDDLRARRLPRAGCRGTVASPSFTIGSDL